MGYSIHFTAGHTMAKDFRFKYHYTSYNNCYIFHNSC